MDQPKIPTLKDSQKPQLKIKGLAAGMSLFERLKQFKRKDLAFILAGLGTLFMAPLAEHFMMAPENGSDTMQAGLGGKGAGGLFNNGGSPYESGITGLAPGGAIGGGGDVITPLNVRDPSALVMGPGGQQQPPAGSLAPQTSPPSSKEPDLKDALANAAARAAGAATRRAPMPVPKPGISGSGLRGLGVIAGGSSAGAGLGAISSKNLAPSGAAGSNSLGSVRPSTGYRGVAGGRGPGKGGGGSEDLKKAAGSASDLFNQKGAGGALETAAAQQMGGGSAFGGAGGGGSGSNDKGPGGSNSPGSKSVGESLEFLRQKKEMEKALDLKWKMKEKKTMFPLELAQEATKTAVMKGVVEPLAGMMGDLMKTSFGPNASSAWSCTGLASPIPASKVGNDGTKCAGKEYYLDSTSGSLTMKRCGSKDSGQSSDGIVGTNCRPVTIGGTPAGAAPPPADPTGGGSLASAPQRAAMQAATEVCGRLAQPGTYGAGLQTKITALNTASGQVITARNNLSGGQGGAAGCGGEEVAATATVEALHTGAAADLSNAQKKLKDMLAAGGAYTLPPEIAAAKIKLDSAATAIGKANTALAAVGTYFGGNPFNMTSEAQAYKDWNTMKAGHEPLAGLKATADLRQTKLLEVHGAFTLVGGETGKSGVVERVMDLRSSHDKLKPIADKPAAEAKPLYTAALKTEITATVARIKQDSPTAVAATGPNADKANAIIAAAKGAAGTEATDANTRVEQHANPPTGVAPLPLPTGAASAQAAAQAAVGKVNTTVGADDSAGLRKEATAVVAQLLLDVNAAATAKPQ